MVNGCSLCKDSEESTDHILIHCDKKSAMDFVVSSLQLVLDVSDLCEKSPPRMEIKGLDKKKRVVWHLALICLFWYIWKEKGLSKMKSYRINDWRSTSVVHFQSGPRIQ